MKNYFSMTFDNWEDAVRFQKESLQYCLDRDMPIRCADISSEINYDTKRAVYSVLVRAFIITHEEREVPW